MRPPPPPQLLPAITRDDIARVCAATADASPLHLDDAFARRAGYPSVVVPGTFLLGWVGQFLEAWAGDFRNLANWEIRFLAPIWPGEQIRLEGRLRDTIPYAEVRASTLDGRTVGVTQATFRSDNASEEARDG